jgi:MYXO-CTERM domain-containing protein
MGLCMSDCQQDCNTKCADAPNQGECRASCAHCCSSDCHDKCDAAPEPVCEPVCETACTGSCEGRANIDCQVSCQSETFVTCKTQVVEECKNECTTTGAAIFCNGQFLATAGDLQACADEIYAEFNVTLDVEVSVECQGDSCTAEVDAEGTADGKAGCSAAPARPTRSQWGLGLVALAGLGFGAWRRRPRGGARS